MRAFDVAWAVLKAEKVAVGSAESPVGEGGFRKVFPNRRNMNEVIKLPGVGGQQMTNIAAMDALAQMGYPVMPEKPVLGYETGGTLRGPFPATTQQRANAVVSDEKARLNNDPDTTWEEQVDFQNLFREEVEHPLTTYGPIQDPLMRAIGVRDVREANAGIFDDGMKAIDFETTNLAAYREPNYEVLGGRTFSGMPPLDNWLKVPDEQRRRFIDIYGDTSRFDAWDEARGNTGHLGTLEEAYRKGVRNLQLMNDMIDNPEQRRLYEFHDPDSSQTRDTQNWRERIMQHRNNDSAI